MEHDVECVALPLAHRQHNFQQYISQLALSSDFFFPSTPQQVLTLVCILEILCGPSRRNHPTCCTQCNDSDCAQPRLTTCIHVCCSYAFKCNLICSDRVVILAMTSYQAGRHTTWPLETAKLRTIHHQKSIIILQTTTCILHDIPPD
jgi:hypothetical protein